MRIPAVPAATDDVKLSLAAIVDIVKVLEIE